jgi:hypothetical protein
MEETVPSLWAYSWPNKQTRLVTPLFNDVMSLTVEIKLEWGITTVYFCEKSHFEARIGDYKVIALSVGENHTIPGTGVSPPP